MKSLEERYNIAIEALRVIGSYIECDCGCPNKRSARIGGTPTQVWALANITLLECEEEVKVYKEED